MSQTNKVKKAIEVAAKGKASGATQAEATVTAAAWRAVCDDPETSNDLRSLALTHRRELEGAIAREDSTAREAALQALAALAASN